MPAHAFHHAIASLPRRSVMGVMEHTAFVTDEAVLHFSWTQKGHPIIPDQHDWDQTMIAIAGTFDLVVDDTRFQVKAGDLCYVPSNAQHWIQVTSDEPAYIMQVFAPIRKDYEDLAIDVLSELQR